MDTLGLIFAITGTALALSTVVVSWMFNKMKIKAEEKLVNVLLEKKVKNEIQISKLQYDIKKLKKDPPDVESLHKFIALLNVTLQEMKKSERRLISNSLSQSSNRGQADYLLKILSEIVHKKPANISR